MNNLIAAVMMLALLLATLGVWGSIAGYTLTGPEHDPLALFKLLSRMDLPAQIKICDEARLQLVDLYRQDNKAHYQDLQNGTKTPVQNTAEKDRLQGVLDSFECTMSKALPGLREALNHKNDLAFYEDGTHLPFSEQNRKANEIAGQGYRLLRDLNDLQQFNFLKTVFPKGYLNEQEWQTLEAVYLGISNARAAEKVRHPVGDLPVPEYFTSEEFYADLHKATSQIEKIVHDGDTLVGVGNTPQFVLYALRHSKVKLNLVSLALSGWPGYYKSSGGAWWTSIVTQRGLQNYQRYLGENLPVKQKPGRIFFVDLVGGGGGIEFLIHQIRHAYQNTKMPEPDMNIIALNEIGTSFKGQNLQMDAYSLDLEKMALSLDRPARCRVMPQFDAWSWDSWLVDLKKLPSDPKAQIVIDGINKRFGK